MSDEFNEKRKRVVTVERAQLAAQRLINSHFHNPPPAEHARMSIPVNVDDDDIVINDFIQQAANRTQPTEAQGDERYTGPAGKPLKVNWEAIATEAKLRLQDYESWMKRAENERDCAKAELAALNADEINYYKDEVHDLSHKIDQLQQDNLKLMEYGTTLKASHADEIVTARNSFQAATNIYEREKAAYIKLLASQQAEIEAAREPLQRIIDMQNVERVKINAENQRNYDAAGAAHLAELAKVIRQCAEHQRGTNGHGYEFCSCGWNSVQSPNCKIDALTWKEHLLTLLTPAMLEAEAQASAPASPPTK